MRFPQSLFLVLLALSSFISFATGQCEEVEAEQVVSVCLSNTRSGVCFGTEIISETVCSGRTPYCDENGICGREPPFACPGNVTGYFPNPWMCSKFHFCVEGAIDTINCEKNYVYDPENQSCAKRSSQKPCYLFSCSRWHDRERVTYPGDRQVHTLCEDGKPTSAIARCEEGLSFNEDIQTCEVVCQEEGNFMDPDDCHSFYECTRGRGREFKKLWRTCLSKTYFDPSKGYCVKDQGICSIDTALETTTTTRRTSTTCTTDAIPTSTSGQITTAESTTSPSSITSTNPTTAASSTTG